MHKVIVVGDPHAKPSNLDECSILFKWVEKQCIERNVDSLIITGDLCDTHDILRLSVISFWYEIFKNFDKSVKILVIPGNHDMDHRNESDSTRNSLMTFNLPNLIVFDTPTVYNDVGFCPYIHSPEGFVQEANKLDCKTLVAHQTFTGAMYDNGFYAKDGIEPNLVKQQDIISGHIHVSMQVGKCFYVGTPRWESSNDANQDKGVYYYEIENGEFTNKEFISAKGIVSSIEKVIIKEGSDISIPFEKNVKYYVELVGSNTWIIQTKKKLKGRVNIKASPTDRVFKIDIKSEDFLASDYINNFNFIENVNKNEVIEFLRSIECRI